jgi:hypothetical protein
MGARALGERLGHVERQGEERLQLPRAIDQDRIMHQLRMILRHGLPPVGDGRRK